MPKYTIIDEEDIDPDLGVKIILRSDSKYWKIQYNIHGKGQRRRSLKTTKKKQAKLKAYKIAGQLANGELFGNDGKQYTIGEVAEARCQRLREKSRTEETVADFHRRIRQLGAFLPQGMKTPIVKLDLATLEAYESRLRNEGIDTPPAPWSKTGKPRKGKPQRPKTVRDAMKAVRTLMKYARDRGWLSYDPAAGYEFPPRDVTKIVVFSAEELALLYADAGMGDVWRFYTETCLRAKELTWLLKEDVILRDNGRPAAIQIRTKTCPQTGERWQPKHNKQRIVPLTPRAANILAAAMSASASPWAFESPIPNEKQPGKWTDARLRRRLQARLKEVGIARCGLHRFRHTGATYLANDERVSIVKLQRFLGHSDIKETMRYLNPRAEHVADAIQSVDFDKLINPAQANNEEDKK